MKPDKKMKFDLTGMTVNELKELNLACAEAIENLQRKDYEEKVNNFKRALTVLAEEYPYRDCIDDGNTYWSWQELKGCLIV